MLYIGDGLSTANLLGTDAFGQLITSFAANAISVSSYAIGPRRDAALLAAIANQTGGNLYVDEDDGAGRRCGRDHARTGERRESPPRHASARRWSNWAHATVIWPDQGQAARGIGNVLPKQMPPLRTDRDTVVIRHRRKNSCRPRWQLRFRGSGGRRDQRSAMDRDTFGESTIASLLAASAGNRPRRRRTDLDRRSVMAGLAETGRALENGLQEMNELAERAVATGDLSAAESMSQAVLERDPGNVEAESVQTRSNVSKHQWPRMAPRRQWRGGRGPECSCRIN